MTTTPNAPARTLDAVAASIRDTVVGLTDDAGTHVVYAISTVAREWMETDDGPTCEWNEVITVETLPLGEPTVNAVGETVYAITFEYGYNYSDWNDRSGDYDDVDR